MENRKLSGATSFDRSHRHAVLQVSVADRIVDLVRAGLDRNSVLSESLKADILTG